MSDDVERIMREAASGARKRLAAMKVRFVQIRGFHAEHLVGGNLVHELECGHVVEAWCHGLDARPVELRRCEECEEVDGGAS